MSSEKQCGIKPLDLSRWRNLPTILMAAGGAVALIGLLVSWKLDGGKQFAFSWLIAFMFCLSICLGSLFLVIVHHLFDAGWSVPIRRFCEHNATNLFPVMFVLWIPIYLFRYKLYQWMSESPSAHAVKAKSPLFTQTGFLVASLACFAVWWIISRGLRSWSLKQDETGGALPTYRMRTYSYFGIIGFALSLTLGCFMWMKGMTVEWFSTMYGVYYFAGSVWMTLAMVYVITMILNRQGILTDVLHEHQFYFIGSLLFAFTVFYAYIHFAQYFIIWNGNIPEETFWYIIREKGTWFWVGMIIIFGHFFVPFLGLLRIDVKSCFPYMTAIAAWAWLMHYFDMAFNIKPVLFPKGEFAAWQFIWVDFGCLAFMLGVLAKVFIAKFAAHPPYPLKDPRLVEAMGFYHPVPTQLSGGELDEIEDSSGRTKGKH